MTALRGAPVRRFWSPQSRFIALGMQIARLNGRLDEIERQAGMARVTWRGETFTARPIEQNADGSWIMEALQHTGRTAVGTRITVKPDEIEPGTMPAPDQPDTTVAPADDGQAALEAAMAEERKTLVSPAELIKQAQAAKTAITTQGDAGAVPPGPTLAPAAAPTAQQGKAMTGHLADKMKLLASAGMDFQQAVEAKVDAKLAEIAGKKKDALANLDNAFGKIDAVGADADAGIQAINDMIGQMTNQ